jgi:hypothetical protein
LVITIFMLYCILLAMKLTHILISSTKLFKELLKFTYIKVTTYWTSLLAKNYCDVMQVRCTGCFNVYNNFQAHGDYKTTIITYGLWSSRLTTHSLVVVTVT